MSIDQARVKEILESWSQASAEHLGPAINAQLAEVTAQLSAIVQARKGRLYRLAKLAAVDVGGIIKSNNVGTVVSIRAVTENVDLQGDRIRSGAFGRFIQACKMGEEHYPVQVLNHQVEPLTVTGKAKEMVELLPGDTRLPEKLLSKGLGGLMVTTQYNLDTQPGYEAWSNVHSGVLEESSFMFWPSVIEFVSQRTGSGLQAVEPGHLCDIKEIFPIVEFSDVLRAANPLTAHISKSLGTHSPLSPAAVQLGQILQLVASVGARHLDNEAVLGTLRQQLKDAYALTGQLLDDSTEVDDVVQVSAPEKRRFDEGPVVPFNWRELGWIPGNHRIPL